MPNPAHAYSRHQVRGGDDAHDNAAPDEPGGDFSGNAGADDRVITQGFQHTPVYFRYVQFRRDNEQGEGGSKVPYLREGFSGSSSPNPNSTSGDGVS
jgi:hypothetical protein